MKIQIDTFSWIKINKNIVHVIFYVENFDFEKIDTNEFFYKKDQNIKFSNMFFSYINIFYESRYKFSSIDNEISKWSLNRNEKLKNKIAKILRSFEFRRQWIQTTKLIFRIQMTLNEFVDNFIQLKIIVNEIKWRYHENYEMNDNRFDQYNFESRQVDFINRKSLWHFEQRHTFKVSKSIYNLMYFDTFVFSIFFFLNRF